MHLPHAGEEGQASRRALKRRCVHAAAALFGTATSALLVWQGLHPSASAPAAGTAPADGGGGGLSAAGAGLDGRSGDGVDVAAAAAAWLAAATRRDSIVWGVGIGSVSLE
eukprot:359620-Chlamydomonas_euryale.AAC.1